MTCAKGAPEWEPLRPANSTEIFYKDWGEGQAIVFSHGWPPTGTTNCVSLSKGYRVVAHTPPRSWAGRRRPAMVTT